MIILKDRMFFYRTAVFSLILFVFGHVAAGRATGLPADFKLEPGYKPVAEQLEAKRWLSFEGSQGCEIGELCGIRPIYVVEFKEGFLKGDPIMPGDLILGVNGGNLGAEPINNFRAEIHAARTNSKSVAITRWRNGAVSELTVNVIPEPPGLIQGGKRDEHSDFTLGPTGARGWIFYLTENLVFTASSRQILITAVAAGSPADGILAKDDVILGVDGKPFDDDARKVLARAITTAEEKSGLLKLVRWRNGKTDNVELKLKVLGSYSDTAPYNCPKSKAIFEQGCQFIAKKGLQNADIPIDYNALALLASGDREYYPMLAEYARKLAASLKPGTWTWYYGYGNLFLAEYVLATGDKSILPELTRTAKEACMAQGALGTWGHEFYVRPDGTLNGYGCMNQSGIINTIALVLARKAGVDDPAVAVAIDRSTRFLRYYVGKGSIPYGDHQPGASHENNGMCSSITVLFDLLGDSEAVSFFSKMATAAYDERERGHTGCFFSILWALPGVSRCGPLATGAYIKETSWYYDLARAWDGSFAYQRGEDDSRAHNDWDSTGAYMLSYCLPLKSLYITGKKQCAIPALKADEVKDVIYAGRDYFPSGDKNGYNNRTTKQLLSGLSSWSPAVRNRSAEALAKREEDFVPALLKLLAGSDRLGRYGACEALGLLGPKADSAAPQLRALLKDPDVWMQSLACNALASLGPDAKKASMNDLLRLAAQRDPNDPRGMVQRSVATALFTPYPGYSTPTILNNSLEGVDRKLLYPAMSSLLKNDDGAARGSLGGYYSKMTDQDLAVMLPDIITAVKTMSPSDEMFADWIRLAGLELLSRMHIKEGIYLCVSTIEERHGNDFERRLGYLKRYGIHARELIPNLKEKRPTKSPGGAAKYDKAIADIEASKDNPALITLEDFIMKANAAKAAKNNR